MTTVKAFQLKQQPALADPGRTPETEHRQCAGLAPRKVSEFGVDDILFEFAISEGENGVRIAPRLESC